MKNTKFIKNYKNNPYFKSKHFWFWAIFRVVFMVIFIILAFKLGLDYGYEMAGGREGGYMDVLMNAR